MSRWPTLHAALRLRLPLLIGLVAGAGVTALLVPIVDSDSSESTDSRARVLQSRDEGATTTSTIATLDDVAAGTAPAAAEAASGNVGAATATTSTTTPVKLTATDVGVTGADIKVGFLLVDLGGVGKLGVAVPGVDADNQQRAFQAFVDEANEQGIAGRRIAPVYRSYDPTDTNAQLQACNRLTEDDKVFAVISLSMFGDPVLCVTKQHRTLLVMNEGLSDEYYRESAGLGFSTVPGKSRTFRNQVHELHQQGLLRGHKLGVLTAQIGGDNVAVDEGLVPTLREYGYELTHYSKLGSDLGTAQAQVPVEVREMRAKGVDLVFLATNVVFSTNFVQQADSQGYRPTYTTNDFGSNTSDFFIANMPASFQAVGITALRTGEYRVNLPEAAYDAGCRERYTKATGTNVSRSDPSPYGLVMTTCNLVRLFTAGARGAGAGLTRQSISGALQRLGTFDMANTPSGSYAPGKFSAPDFVRTAKADMSCRCWKPVDDYRRARF